MDLMNTRILDLLIDDDEQLEELFLGVNFRQEDNVFMRYRVSIRMTELVLLLKRLEDDGIIEVKRARGYEDDADIAGALFCLTSRGRSMWNPETSRLPGLYELA